MDNANNIICVTSYNSAGMGLDRQQYIRKLQLFLIYYVFKNIFSLSQGIENTATLKSLKFFGVLLNLRIKVILLYLLKRIRWFDDYVEEISYKACY